MMMGPPGVVPGTPGVVVCAGPVVGIVWGGGTTVVIGFSTSIEPSELMFTTSATITVSWLIVSALMLMLALEMLSNSGGKSVKTEPSFTIIGLD